MRYLSKRHVARAFGEGGKPSHNLAARIKIRNDQHAILKITDDIEVDHYALQEIATQFQRFYADLYTLRRDKPSWSSMTT